MLRSEKLKQYKNNNWAYIENNNVVLNTDTYSYWFEDDSFYTDLVLGVNAKYEVIYFKFIGLNENLVKTKVGSLMSKLITELSYAKRKVSLGFYVEPVQTPQIVVEVPVVEEVVTQEDFSVESAVTVMEDGKKIITKKIKK